MTRSFLMLFSITEIFFFFSLSFGSTKFLFVRIQNEEGDTPSMSFPRSLSQTIFSV